MFHLLNKYKLIVIITLCITGSSMTVSTVDPCNSYNTAFSNGEYVKYKIQYHWGYMNISAGEVDFRVTENDQHYIIEATGKTYRSYDLVFKVRDFYKTVIDKETLLPLEFERIIQEGGYSFYNHIFFDQENDLAITYSGRTKDKVKRREFPIESCMHDMLSSVYYLRNLPFTQFFDNKKFPLKMFIDDKVYPIDITYLGEEKKNVSKWGKMDMIKISPEVVAGAVFTNESKMNIWVSNDENKVPMIIESPISVGSIRAVLIEHSGLKHPLAN